MNRRLYGGDAMTNMRGRSASRARQSWRTVFAATARWASSERHSTRRAERHAWATFQGEPIEPHNLAVSRERPVGEVHHLPLAR